MASEAMNSEAREIDGIDMRVLGPGDRKVLDAVAPDVFDDPLRAEWTDEFLADPRHHIVVALDDRTVVGFVSGIHYVHPDKPPELFALELGVAPSHRRRGIATALFAAMLDEGRRFGCREAWVPTEADNELARAFYDSLDGHAGAAPTVHYSFPLDQD